ncbi:flagellar protein FlaG [Halomonas sediminis]
MSSPLTDATSSLSSSALHDLTPRQRLESALDKLPAPGSVLGDAQSDTRTITADELVEPISCINEVMHPHGIEFDLVEEPARVITKVVDRNTGDVIRQIPSEEVLLIAQRLEQLHGRLIESEA